MLCSKTNIGPVAPKIIIGCPAKSANSILHAEAAKITSVTPSCPPVLSSKIPPNAMFVAIIAK